MNDTHILGHPYGQVIRRHEDSALIMTESIYRPGTIIKTHSHRHAYFCFILHGTYLEKYGKHNRNCKSSSVVFHPPNETHSTQFFQDGARLFRFEMKPDLFDRIREYARVLCQPAEFDGGVPAQLAAKLYREFRRADDISVLVTEGLALEIAACVARGRSNEGFKTRPIWLTQACNLIHEEFSSSLSLSRIAKTAGVHPLYFARVFRQFECCTVGEYIRQVRVDFAARQLSKSQMSLAEVAVASGFCDQAHFSKTFRLLTGMTPAQYRSVFTRLRLVQKR